MKFIEYDKSAVFCIYDNIGKALWVDASANYQKKVEKIKIELESGTFEDELFQQYANIYGVDSLSVTPVFFCDQKDLMTNKFRMIIFLSPVFQSKKGGLKLGKNEGELDYLVVLVRKHYKGQTVRFSEIYDFLVSNGHTTETQKRVAIRLKPIKKIHKRDDNNRTWLVVS